MINPSQSTPNLLSQVAPFATPPPDSSNPCAQQPMQLLRIETAATPTRAAYCAASLRGPMPDPFRHIHSAFVERQVNHDA